MKEIKPFTISGQIRASASKSYLQRALLMAAFADSVSHLENISLSDDVLAVRRIIEQLGVIVEGEENWLVIPGKMNERLEIGLNVGESGLALRIVAFLSSLFNGKVCINGEGTLLRRPLIPLTESLVAAGIAHSTEKNSLPLIIYGPISNHNISIDASYSSQMLSGLLMTLPLLESDSHVRVNNLNSKPYIELTIDLMNKFGIDIMNNNNTDFFVRGKQKYHGSRIFIEGDWSGASNFLVAAALSGEISVSGLNKHSLQADRAILKALELTGAIVRWTDNIVIVSQSKNKAFDFDATHCPDLFPPLVLLAAGAHGRSRIKGIHRLIHKESNRLQTLQNMFSILGLKIQTDSDDMLIDGVGRLSGGTTDSFNDHRIAMAAATAACLADSPITVLNAGSVNKSYPSFFLHLQQLSRLR